MHIKVASWLKYKIKAGNLHHIHSPFVYSLYNEVITNDLPFYAYERADLIYRYTARSTEYLNFIETSKMQTSMRKRPVPELAAFYSPSFNTGALIFRLVNRFSPQTIVEVGATIGLSTAWLRLGASKANIFAFDNCDELARYSGHLLEIFDLPTVHHCIGDNVNKLPDELAGLMPVDFALLSNYYLPSQMYECFNLMLPYLNPEACLVVAGPHESAENERYWNLIKEHPQVRVTIDLFKVGLVFFHTWQAKEHFILKF